MSQPRAQAVQEPRGEAFAVRDVRSTISTPGVAPRGSEGPSRASGVVGPDGGSGPEPIQAEPSVRRQLAAFFGPGVVAAAFGPEPTAPNGPRPALDEPTDAEATGAPASGADGARAGQTAPVVKGRAPRPHGLVDVSTPKPPEPEPRRSPFRVVGTPGRLDSWTVTDRNGVPFGLYSGLTSRKQAVDLAARLDAEDAALARPAPEPEPAAPPTDDSRRLRRTWLTDAELDAIMRSDDGPKRPALLSALGLPADVVVVRRAVDAERECVAVTLRSATFPPVRIGSYLPVLPRPLDFAWRDATCAGDDAPSLPPITGGSPQGDEAPTAPDVEGFDALAPIPIDEGRYIPNCRWTKPPASAPIPDDVAQALGQRLAPLIARADVRLELVVLPGPSRMEAYRAWRTALRETARSAGLPDHETDLDRLEQAALDVAVALMADDRPRPDVPILIGD